MKPVSKLFRISYVLIVLYTVFAVSPLVGDVERPSLGGITGARATATLRIFAVETFLAAFLDTVVSDAVETTLDGDGSFMVKKLRARPVGNELLLRISSANHLLDGNSALLLPEAPSLVTQASSHHTTGFTIARPVKGYGTHFSGLAPPSLLS